MQVIMLGEHLGYHRFSHGWWANDDQSDGLQISRKAILVYNTLDSLAERRVRLPRHVGTLRQERRKHVQVEGNRVDGLFRYVGN